VLAGFALVILLRKLQLRLQLSRAKHRSLTGHSRMARRFASLVPFYEYDEAQFFGTDGAPEDVVALCIYRGGPHANLETYVRGKCIYQAPSLANPI